MKKEYLFQFFILLILGVCCSFHTPLNEKLLVSGCGWKQVAILDKATGQIEWSHPLGEGEDCNDVEMTKQGHILYAYTTGARLINRQQQVIWDFKAQKGEELFTATQLPSGNYMLAICGNPSRILELNPKGKMVDEIAFDTAITGVHDQFRQIVKTSRHTYLIPLMGTGEVIEMDRDKNIVSRTTCGGNPFAIQITPNGNWLVSCGDAHDFVEIDSRNKKVTRRVSSNDLQNVSLLFVAELVRYSNGNTLICNWNGHSQDKSQPLLVEIDPENRIRWRLPLNQEIINISTVYSFIEK